MRRLAVLAFAMMVLGSCATEPSTPDAIANDVASSVMSPFCPGITLHDCPTRAAIALRDRIESWALDGWSRDRIMTELVAEYGEPVRAVPAGGLTAVARALPILALLAGGALSLRAIARWRARPPEEILPPSSSERAALQEELARRRETRNA